MAEDLADGDRVPRPLEQDVVVVALGLEPWPWNSGRYFSTGSSSLTFPSSTSIISAVAVIGLDCEAIQNSASVAIGLPASTSA